MTDNHAQSTLRDVGSIAGDDLPLRTRPAGSAETPVGFEVVCRQSVIEEIHRHGASSMDREVCGVLMGRLYRDEVGPFLAVDGSIRGEYASNETAQVTFTSETWSHIHRVKAEAYPDCEIVGWYHTHPGFGIFLSPMDLFIHENFFDLSWQVAFVHDPQRREDGMFVWRNGKAVREPHTILRDEVPATASHVASDAESLPPIPAEKACLLCWFFAVLAVGLVLASIGLAIQETRRDRQPPDRSNESIQKAAQFPRAEESVP